MSRLAFWKWVFATVLCVLLANYVLAQDASKPAPKYDPKTETKLKGTIDEIKIVPGNDEGEHFILRPATGDPILVHVCPEAFLKAMETSYAKGDQVEVVGSKVVSREGENEILAKEVTKDNASFTLRDNKGVPVWKGWNFAK